MEMHIKSGSFSVFRLNRTKVYAAFILLPLLIVSCTSSGEDQPVDEANAPAPTSTPTEVAAATAVTVDQLSIVEIVEQSRASVVAVFVTRAAGQASGTGIIISENGTILTNNHVIDGAIDIQVDLQENEDSEHKRFPAELLGADPDLDIAVLQIRGGPFKAAQVGSIEDLELGEEVVAIGFPLASLTGAGITVTEGIVSSKFNDGFRNVIQHQASVNPGSSGGPLISRGGQVVGINTFVLRQAAGTNVEGFNFAVAIDEATSRLDHLIERGPPQSSGAATPVVNEKHGFSLTLPPGWNIVFRDEDNLQAASSMNGGFFAVSAESDLSGFASAEEWSNGYHSASTSFLQAYELLDEEFSETPDGQLAWTFTGRHEAKGVPFLGIETLIWSGQMAARFYTEAPEMSFQTSLQEFGLIIQSFEYDALR